MSQATPRERLDHALATISTELDALGDEVAGIAGGVAAMTTMGREQRNQLTDVHHKLDGLLDILRHKVLPVIGEVPRLKQRIIGLEMALEGREQTGADAE